MEAVLSIVRSGVVLDTYDFVDVINQKEKAGWQVKSTKASTPVTWKRAKIPNADRLIEGSRKGAKGLQRLGDSIMAFCNNHAKESLEKYQLDEIVYSRLLVFPGSEVTYFERSLCTRDAPTVFEPSDFEWYWSKPKNTKKKEQLPALHGIHKASDKKWWAWHGLGENQLHFSGEDAWWPQPGSEHSITFPVPSADDRIPLEELLAFVERS